MLARLEAAGWLTSEWEQIDPSEAARPRQRFYRLTGKGANNASTALNRLSYPVGELAWSS
jgi:DNA-binding PadR family transcriptional regulator